MEEILRGYKTKTLLNYNYQVKNFNIIADLWLCGPAEKDHLGQKFDGAFPAGFLKRWKASFEEYIPANTNKILHVCAGRTPKSEGKTLDIDSKYDPDYLCNAETMRYGSLEEGEHRVPADQFTWVISDTPYNKDAANKYYNKAMVNRSKVLQQMTRVCEPKGFIGILDQIMPVSPPRVLKCVARIGVTSVPNLDMRIFTVFRKLAC